MPLPPGGSVRALEDFLINECLTQGIIRGKLDQAQQALHVRWALARDVPPPPAPGQPHTSPADGRCAAMAARLNAWAHAAHGVLSHLHTASASTAAAGAAQKTAAADLAARIEAAKAAVVAQMDTRGGGRGSLPGGFQGLDEELMGHDAAGALYSAHGPGSQGMMMLGDDERAPAGRSKRRR